MLMAREMKKELAIILILSILMLSAGELIDSTYQGVGQMESSYGPYSFSFAVNSIDLSQIAITLQWVCTFSSPETEKPTVAYFIPGTEFGLSYARYSYPLVWFDSSAWRLIDTDNRTFWAWRVTNVLHNLPWSQKVPLNFSYSPVAFYPWEILVLDVYIGTSQSLAGSSPPQDVHYAGPRDLVIEDQLTERLQDPYLSISSQFDSLSVASLPTDFAYRLGGSRFQPSYYYHVSISINHRAEVRMVALLGIIFAIVVQPILLWRIIRIRNSMGNSNYLQTCLGFLLFLPILLFTFRTSIAPSWITNFDLFLLLDIFAWAVLLLDRLGREKYQTYTGLKD